MRGQESVILILLATYLDDIVGYSSCVDKCALASIIAYRISPDSGPGPLFTSTVAGNRHLFEAGFL